MVRDIKKGERYDKEWSLSLTRKFLRQFVLFSLFWIIKYVTIEVAVVDFKVTIVPLKSLLKSSFCPSDPYCSLNILIVPLRFP